MEKLMKQEGYQTGTPSVPHDMSANVHAGEMIIPGSFADALRRGDITLGGPGGAGGTGTTVQVYVEGSIIAERDLIQKLERIKYSEARRGRVTAGV